VSALRWKRTELDGATEDGEPIESTEILTLVRIDGETEIRIEICAGPEIGDDFVGLYALDGDQLQLDNCSWDAVDASEVPAEVIITIETDWECGSCRVERLP
jgi:hypothetical protein